MVIADAPYSLRVAPQLSLPCPVAAAGMVGLNSEPVAFLKKLAACLKTNRQMEPSSICQLKTLLAAANLLKLIDQTIELLEKAKAGNRLGTSRIVKACGIERQTLCSIVHY